MTLINALEKLEEPKVHDVRSLGWDGDSEVKSILLQICKQVQPIMKKRNWMVPLVSEFYPSNACLLGLNVGGGGGRTREIKIRVRSAGNKSRLLPYESLLGTMLHELVHNVRGPHDSAFYKLLDELTEECEDLMSKGITGSGSGFDGPSCGRLGAHSFIPTHNPAPEKARSLAAQAAEARAKRARIMSNGPQKLGSASGMSWRNMSPTQAAAAAAERRAADDVWCPCGHDQGLDNTQGPLKLPATNTSDRAQSAASRQPANSRQPNANSTQPAPLQGASIPRSQMQGKENQDADRGQPGTKTKAGSSHATQTALPGDQDTGQPFSTSSIPQSSEGTASADGKGGVFQNHSNQAVHLAAAAAMARSKTLDRAEIKTNTRQIVGMQQGSSSNFRHRNQISEAMGNGDQSKVQNVRGSSVSGRDQNANKGGSGKAEGTRAVIDLTLDSDDGDDDPQLRAVASTLIQDNRRQEDGKSSRKRQVNPIHPPSGVQQFKIWSCPVCTYMNRVSAAVAGSSTEMGLSCEMCLTPCHG